MAGDPEVQEFEDLLERATSLRDKLSHQEEDG